jgi:D-threo-aldose 1-dehydrogenase
VYTPVSDGQATATVRRALDRGLRCLDTAPSYAAPHYAGEPAVTRVRDVSRDGVLRSLEESLVRLRTDRVDLVCLHDTHAHEDAVYAHAYPALAELRSQGVIGAVGVALNDTAMLTRLVQRLDLDVVLCAGRYTLLEQTARHELLSACRRRGVSVVVGGVHHSGVLVGPDHHHTTYAGAPAPEPVIARARLLAKICAVYGVPLRAAALQYPLRHPAVVSVLTGCRSPEEVDDNLAMFEMDVPEALWHELHVTLHGTRPLSGCR